MSRFLAYLWRFAVILTGFIAAVLAAAFFTVWLATAGLDALDTGDTAAQIGLAAAALVLASLMGYIAFVPAVLAIAWAEWGEKTGWLFHALAGAAIALAGFAVWPFFATDDGVDSGLLAVSVAAGIVGGTVYWLIAGRRSGELLTLLAGEMAD